MIRLCCFAFLMAFGPAVNAQAQRVADSVTVFTAVNSFLTPRDGMHKFRARWVYHLDRLVKAGMLDQTNYADKVFKLIVTNRGSLSVYGDLRNDMVLSSFLKDEKKWTMGIQSGRPVSSLLILVVPKEVFEGIPSEELLVQENLVRQETLQE